MSAQDRFSGSGVFARDCDELVDISPLDLKDRSVTEWGFAYGASAWRVETVIRDFEPKAPLDMIFEYPVHHVDETGYLGEFSILSPQSVGGNKRGEQRREERDENIAKLEELVLGRDSSLLDYTAKDLAEVFGKSPKTISNWACKSEKLRVEKVGNTNFITPASSFPQMGKQLVIRQNETETRKQAI